MNLGTLDYVSVVRHLPRPSLAQTERFARYVSNTHSWYKHLPIDPKVPFVFYLDPGAGMSRVHTPTGEIALVEITDEKQRFHYTWQKTQDYRRRFGYWNYHAPYGTSFYYAGEGGVVSTAGAGLRILSQAGDWVSVPPELTDQSTALVDAFIHPCFSHTCPMLGIWDKDPARFGLSTTPDQDDNPFSATAHPVLRCLWNVLERNRRADPDPSEVVRRIPPQARELIQEAVAQRSAGRWFSATEEGGWDWPEESWLEHPQLVGMEAGLLASVIRYLEVERMRALAVNRYLEVERLAVKRFQERDHDSPEWPTEGVCTLIGQILAERGRQLAEMTEAMGRLLGAVFPS